MSYIGKTIRSLKSRKTEHVNDALNNTDNFYFTRALKKYGVDNFDWDIIDECDDIDELNRLEVYYIGYYDTYDNGYNLTIGGEGINGYEHTEEAKEKISQIHKGKPKSKEHRQKLSESEKGKMVSLKTRQRIAKATKAGKNPHAKSIMLIHPDDAEERFDCMMDAVRKYDLHSSGLTEAAQGKRKHEKGYNCRYLN